MIILSKIYLSLGWLPNKVFSVDMCIVVEFSRFSGSRGSVFVLRAGHIQLEDDVFLRIRLGLLLAIHSVFVDSNHLLSRHHKGTRVHFERQQTQAVTQNLVLQIIVKIQKKKSDLQKELCYFFI